MSEQRENSHRRGKKPAPNAQEVVYTQPRPFRRRRFIVHLATLFALVLAVFLGMSVFFRVDTILVAGASKYSAATIVEASGLRPGQSLLFFGRASTGDRILKKLPYVSKVLRFDVDLPGTLTIWVEEIPVVYAIQQSNGNWWLMSSDGRLTEQVDAARASQCTQILGVTLRSPTAGEQAHADVPGQYGITTGADHLAAALEILQQIERNELMGKIVTVDVSNLQKLEIWYESRFQINLGDKNRLDYKIAAAKATVEQMSSNRRGILDASFTTYPDQINYLPFSE